MSPHTERLTATDAPARPRFRPVATWAAALAIGSASAFAVVAPSPVSASHSDTRAPTAPSSLKATAGTERVSLAWTASTDNVGVAGYHVWRRLSSGTDWDRIASTSAGTRAYTDAAVTAGRSYTYAVRAYDKAGNVSASSPFAVATPLAESTTTAPAPEPTPTPTPTPAPTEPVSGDVVWTADAERHISEEWASISTHNQDPGGNKVAKTNERAGVFVWPDSRFQRLTGAAQGTYAYKAEVRDGDSSYGERAEVGMGNDTRSDMTDRLFSEGQERWISWQTKLGSNYPISNSRWQVVAQWKQLGSLGSPALSMEAKSGRWEFKNHSSAGNRTWALGPAALERWTKFTLRVKFSPSSSTGFVELFGDLGDGKGMRQLVARTNVATMKTDGGRTVQSHARLGIYRDPSISGTANAWYDGYTVATTRSAAEANAF